MLTSLVRTTCAAAVTWALVGAVAAAAQTPSPAAERRATEVPFQIGAQPIYRALKEFASQANLQLIYETTEVRADIQSSDVAGDFTPEAALSRLLAHTNLAYKFINERTVSIRSSGALPTRSDTAYAQPRPAEIASESIDGGPADSSAKTQGPDRGANTTPSNGRATLLDEVLVTAQKRSERLQDVPVPVTQIGAGALISSNQARLQDYYTRVPGLSVTPDDADGFSTIAIRGVTTGANTNPTVGVTIDDVPFGSSTQVGGGGPLPDIDPSELSSIEVLRGPQGTLYGANSLGGLLKYVTVDPSTDAISGSVRAGVTGVRNGPKAGYSFRGAVNIPVGDQLAFRASAFTRRDPGYIDNPVLHEDGVNSQRVSGGRLAGLWRPSDAFSVKVNALFQDYKSDGLNHVDLSTDGFPQTLGLGDLQQNYMRGTGWSESKIQSYSVTLNGTVSGINLTSVTGYNVNRSTASTDLSAYYFPFTLTGIPDTGFDGFGVSGAPNISKGKTTKVTQEARMSAPLGDRVEWLLGGFFTHEKSSYENDTFAADTDTARVVGTWLISTTPSTFQEYAAFTDFTFHLTDQFSIQLGARESRIEQSFDTTESGVYVPVFLGVPSPFVQPEANTTANAFTYLVTPQYKISPDLMVYARLASGYRPGGPNLASGADVPSSYAPDKTRNYEIGTKGSILGRLLTFDASVYYINWKDIQLQLFTNGNLFTANGSQAKSQGVELSLESKPFRGLTISTWAAWNDAVLTSAFPATSLVYGQSGDRLPYSSRFSGNLSIDQEVPLTERLSAFGGVSLSYIGERQGVFQAQQPEGVPQRQIFPAYATTDLHIGLRANSWSVSAFLNNVTDRRGLLVGGQGTLLPFAFNVIPPRTGGLLVTKEF